MLCSLYNTSKLLHIYQGCFIDRGFEYANIILPVTFGYELPIINDILLKKFQNLYLFQNNNIKMVRQFICNNWNIKTPEDSILSLQFILEFFNRKQNKNFIYLFMSNVMVCNDMDSTIVNTYFYALSYDHYINFFVQSIIQSDLSNYTISSVYHNT